MGASQPVTSQRSSHPPVGVAAETSNLSHASAGGIVNPLHRALFEKVKRGEVDGVTQLVQESNIDIANLVDEPKNFSQTPIFSACIIPDKELALRMIKMLVNFGVDPKREDSLKQTPLFYIAREGNTQAIQYLCGEHHVDVNKPDKYG